MEVQRQGSCSQEQSLRILKRCDGAAGGDVPAELTSKDITHLIRDGVLTCPICLEVFIEPKTLPCLHTYCKNCLFRLVECRAKRQRQIRCPECREVIVLRKAGLGDLRSSFFVNSLMEIYNAKRMSVPCSVCQKSGGNAAAVSKCMTCRDGLCARCTEGHSRSTMTVEHKIVPLEEFASGNLEKHFRESQIFPCKNHGRNLDYYCNTCEEVACRDCLLLEHNNHSNTTIKIAFSEKKEQLDALIADVKAKVANIDISQNKIAKFKENAEKKSVEMNRTIIDTGKSILRLVEKDVTEAKKTAKEGSQSRIEMLSKFKEDLSIRLKQERSSLEFCESIMAAGKPVEILDMQKMLRKRLNQLSQEEDKVILEQIEADTRIPDVVISERFRGELPLAIFRQDPKSSSVCDGETQTDPEGACGGCDADVSKSAAKDSSKSNLSYASSDADSGMDSLLPTDSMMDANRSKDVESTPSSLTPSRGIQSSTPRDQLEVSGQNPVSPATAAAADDVEAVTQAVNAPVATGTDPLLESDEFILPSVTNYVIYQMMGMIVSLLMHYIMQFALDYQW